MSALSSGAQSAGAAPPAATSAAGSTSAGVASGTGAAATPAAAATVSWPMWSSALMMGTVGNVATVGYTPEQWAALQHQNWQQWAHWQEQYAHWHMQYGEKYTEMMNLGNYQVGTQPPLPPANPSEVRPPPPPDAPPPQTSKSSDNKDAADPNAFAYNCNPAYYTYQAPPTKSQTNDKKNTEWNSDGTLRQNDYQSAKGAYPDENAWYNQTQMAAYQYQNMNMAISEEERQFDIQFKKWEEEFEAWKQQNVNHPDKTAYQDYEKKFQACRAQLMERKEQMRSKRMAAMMSQRPPSLTDNQKNAAMMSYYQNQNFAAKLDSNDRANSYEAGLSKGDNANDRSMDVFGKQTNVKGIPGLDLVGDEYSRKNPTDIIDITGDNEKSSSKKPDLKAISKGINNILGDQKLLNMLSIVTQSKNDSVSNDKRFGSRWTDDSTSAQTKYPGSTSQYDYGETSGQNYQQTSYSTSHIPSLLDPLPFPVPFFSNSSQSSAQLDSDKYGSHSRSRTEDSISYDPNVYQDMYQSSHSYARHGYYDSVESDSYNVSDRSNDIGPTAKPIWMDYPIFEPMAIVDYDHKPLKPIIEFLEPVQTFDYGHVSSVKGNLKEDKEKLWIDGDNKKLGNKNTDYLNKGQADEVNDGSNYRTKNSDDRSREGDRTRRYERNHARNRDYEKREERSRNRYEERNRYREKRDKCERRSNSREETPKKIIDSKPESPKDETFPDQKEEQTDIEMDVKNIVMIDDILELPGRDVRPEKIVIILRGLPGSGKSYLAKLIKDREVENGGSTPRILSMDDYFMSETEVFVEDLDTGRKTKKREMKYEYDESMESAYISSLTKAFKRTISDGFFPFIIVDSINDQLSHYGEMEAISKQYGFKVYICELDVDVLTCHKRNIHDRKLEDVKKLADNWSLTPVRFTTLDITTLLQVAAIDHVQMEDVSDDDIDDQPVETSQNEEEEVQAPFSSKWDNMDDTDKLARLDGTSKPLRHTASTMEDFLQLDDWALEKTSQPGKKTVRWADIEEHRKQEKMRAIGFVVGQTDWQRMTDPTQGSSALTQTKYIERLPKY